MTATAIAPAPAHTQTTPLDVLLTGRQGEVVSRLAQGLSGVEIAAQLGLSPETVRAHIRNASRRSGARTRAHLVALALGVGMDAGAQAPPAATPVVQDVHDGATATPAQLIDHVLETAREMLGMDAAFVADTRTATQDVVAVAGDAASFGTSAGASGPLENTYCELILDGQLDVVPDSSQEPLVSGLACTAASDIGAYIGVPVTLGDGSVYGTFCCMSHEPDTLLRAKDAQFLRVLARLIADLLERDALEAERRQMKARAEKVDVLLSALAARDGYTEEHSTAVVELALGIGRELGLGEAELDRVESVAQLHDIGKIGIPDEILGKPDKLTEQEWNVMRTHPAIGERIALSVPSLAPLARAIRAEHERWDGGGYPDGLVGDSIPLPSRIVLVADAYHAMTSDRPYRTAMPADAALGELQRNSGRQFWPEGVEAALRHLGGSETRG